MCKSPERCPGSCSQEHAGLSLPKGTHQWLPCAGSRVQLQPQAAARVLPLRICQQRAGNALARQQHGVAASWGGHPQLAVLEEELGGAGQVAVCAWQGGRGRRRRLTCQSTHREGKKAQINMPEHTPLQAMPSHSSRNSIRRPRHDCRSAWCRILCARRPSHLPGAERRPGSDAAPRCRASSAQPPSCSRPPLCPASIPVYPNLPAELPTLLSS